jgi:arsenite methyltransferase
VNPRDRFHAAFARQLGRPGGFAGRLVARALDRGNRGTIAAAVEALDLAPKSVAADIGFGGGIGLRLLLDLPEVRTAIGVDPSAEMLKSARRRFAAELERGELRLQPGSLTELPLADGSLDGAITVNTIYFVEDLGRALGELARTLRPSGRLVIGVGDPEAMEQMPFTTHGFRLRPIADLEASITGAGLDLVGHRRVGEGKVPSHLLIAARSPRPGADYLPCEERACSSR